LAAVILDQLEQLDSLGEDLIGPKDQGAQVKDDLFDRFILL
jgi:hypothetical protein